MTNNISGGIILKESHNEQPKGKRSQPRITPENSISVENVPHSIPIKYMSWAEIKEKEKEGRTVIFVVIKTTTPSPNGHKSSIELNPLRNSDRDYLVIVCW